MNLNQLAKDICAKEAGKINLPIAQVKEVIGAMCEVFAVSDGDDLLELVELMDSTGKKRLNRRRLERLRPKPKKKARKVRGKRAAR